MPLFSKPRARATEPPLNPTNQPKSAWEYYLEITGIEDTEREREWQDLLDVILVFAALFASFLSTFLIQTLSLLQEDPLGAIQDILLYQTLVMQNGTSEPYVAPVFSPPSYAVAVNALFFASLAVVLVAAFLCMLVKGWIRELDRKLRGIPDLQQRAVIKELREQGLVRWRLPEMITILPSLIHLSLVLFFIGLALYLLQVHKLPAFLSISIFGIGVLLYVLSIFISAIDDFSPFRSPYSRAFGVLYRRLYSRLISLLDTLDYHFSSFPALPQTTAEEMRERMVRFIMKHKPLFEQAILDPRPSSHEHIISQTSAPVLNKLWGSVSRQDASTYAKNISTAILFQLDDLSIRPPQNWQLPWLYETSNLSIKEAECLVYTTCIQKDMPQSPPFWEIIHASLDLLDQRRDPWFHLVTLLVHMRVSGDHWDMLKSPGVRGGLILNVYWWFPPNIAAREAELLQAISDVLLSKEQWCFVLSSISTHFGQADPEDIPAIARILVRLLQRGFSLRRASRKGADKPFDFWLHVMVSLLDKSHKNGRSSLDGEVLHAEDIEACGKCRLRDPNCIRQLLRVSQDHEYLDPSLMTACLAAILQTLIKNRPKNQQEARLVDQYLDIIGEDVVTWNISLSGPLANFRFQPRTILYLLRGKFLNLVGDPGAAIVGRTILHEYDLKLSAADAQPTTSILTVIDEVLTDSTLITGLELQNPWLSLYAGNLTQSSHSSTIPVVWSPGCTSIASKRLDLYDDGTVTPEVDLVTFFLSSPSASIACRALRWYLRLEETALTRDGIQYFISFPIIFCKGHTGDENCESWLLLVELFVENWNDTPLKWRSHFAGAFFGYESSEANNQSTAHESALSVGLDDEEKDNPDKDTQASTAQSDGLGWMEDVWVAVLRPMVRKVYWSGLSGVMHAVYPESAEPEGRTSLSESSADTLPDAASEGGPHGAAPALKQVEERMRSSARGLLGILAFLLEAGADSMPTTLLDRIRNSCLLSDECLDHDTDSLRRIRAALNRNQEG